jgi:hypothetical protein
VSHRGPSSPIGVVRWLAAVASVGRRSCGSHSKVAFPTHGRASLVGLGLLVQASTFSLVLAGSGLVVRCLADKGFICPLPLFII